MRIAWKLAVIVGLFGFGMAIGLADKDPRTERLWKAKCAGCHGDDGKGQTEQAKKMGGIADLTAAATQKDLDDAKIKKTILEGLKKQKDGKTQEMDAFKEKLRPEQVDALVAYVKGLAK